MSALNTIGSLPPIPQTPLGDTQEWRDFLNKLRGYTAGQQTNLPTTITADTNTAHSNTSTTLVSTKPWQSNYPYVIDLHITGGTLTGGTPIQFSRDGITQITVTSDIVTLNQKDWVTIAFSVAPTLTVVPR